MKLIDYNRSEWKPVPINPIEPDGPASHNERIHRLLVEGATDILALAKLTGRVNSDAYGCIPPLHAFFTGTSGEPNGLAELTIAESDKPREPWKVFDPATGAVQDIPIYPQAAFSAVLPEVP